MSDLKDVFGEIYDNNLWTIGESKSGAGSELKSTEVIRKELPEVIKKFNIKTVLDIPCGDFNWMSHVGFDGVEYMGADIVESMIEENKKKFGNVNFKVLDITKDELPKVDLVFARDILGHFDLGNIQKALTNIIQSGSKYLLTTSFKPPSIKASCSILSATNCNVLNDKPLVPMVSFRNLTSLSDKPPLSLLAAPIVISPKIVSIICESGTP